VFLCSFTEEQQQVDVSSRGNKQINSRERERALEEADVGDLRKLLLIADSYYL